LDLGPISSFKGVKKVGPHNASEAVRPRRCRNGVTLQPVNPLRLIWPDCGRQKLKSKKLFDPSSCIVCSEQKSNRRTQHNAYPCNPITHVRGRQPSSFVGFYLRQQSGGVTCYEIDRQLCVVCYRVSKPTPKVASRQHQCAGCGATIRVARRSPATPPKVCIQCVRRDVAIAPVLS
jgi:hypothetical protein